MTTRDDVVLEAMSWIGVSYKHAGRNMYGVDCAGLIIKVANGTGLSSYDTTNYPRRPNPSDFLREMRDHLDRRQLRDATRADVVVFRGPRVPCHLGILVHDNLLVHAYAPAKKVVIEPFAGQLRCLAVMALSFRGLED